MPRKSVRHPVKNFFLKKRLQLKIILTVFSVVTITSIITTIILAIIYNSKTSGGNFFYMSSNTMEDLKLMSILSIILPSLITAQAVTLIIAAAIGLFSSRKAAVPVYKLEKWAFQIKSGHLKTQLGFRDNKEMKDLEVQCNALTNNFRHLFSDIEHAVQNIQEDKSYNKSPLVKDSLEKISQRLSEFDY